MTSVNLFCVFLCLFATAVRSGHGYKIGILVPDMSGSQVMFNQRVAETLVDAGHNVTLIRLRMIKGFDDGLKIKSRQDIKEIAIDGTVKGFDYKRMRDIQQENGFKDHSIWHFFLDAEQREMLANISTGMSKGCENMIEQKDKMELLRAEQFDVMFSHMYDYCPIGIIEAVKPKSWAWLNSGALMDYIATYIGLELPASYAAPMMADASDRLSFGQRFKSILGHTITPFMFAWMTGNPQTEAFRRVFGPDFRHLVDAAKTAPLVFVNSNELYDLPRPTLHKIVNIGGLGMKPEKAKPLPKDMQQVVDAAESVVVFTFGSLGRKY